MKIDGRREYSAALDSQAALRKTIAAATELIARSDQMIQRARSAGHQGRVPAAACPGPEPRTADGYAVRDL